MAYEGFFYWKDWANYLGRRGRPGTAPVHELRHGAARRARPATTRRSSSTTATSASSTRSGTPTAQGAHPVFDTHAFCPPKRPDDPHFWDSPSDELTGAIYTPGSGYINDPQLATHNLQRAAEAHGGEFLFRARSPRSAASGGRVAGRHAQRRDRDRRAGGGQRRRPALVPRQPDGGRRGRHERQDARPLRHEVHHVPAPPGFDFEHDGFHTSDGDTGIYFRPESGNNILIGSEDPDCDPREWVDDPDDYDRARHREAVGGAGLPARPPHPDAADPNERKGVVDLYDVSDDWIPIYDRSTSAASTWRSGRAATSSRTRRVVGHADGRADRRGRARPRPRQGPGQGTCRYTGLELDAASTRACARSTRTRASR